MGATEAVENFTRQSLRKATKFTEGDYRGVNPREFFRSLNRTLEEIQQDGDFKYTTSGGPTESLTIESEDVGSKTGTVEGRLIANSEYTNVNSGSTSYRPYGPLGAALIISGVILSIVIVGLVIIPIGAYLYLKEDRGELPLMRQDAIRALMTGEVSERTITEDGQERTDIFANMTVTYAGDTFMKIDSEEVRDLSVAHRKKLLDELKGIYNRIVDDEELRRNRYTGVLSEFVMYTKAVANRSADDDMREIAEMQSTLNQDFERRNKYSDRLRKFVSESQSERYEDTIMQELESLSEDMDVYVEREGLDSV